jgi:outer membrane protein assembly factor BamB
MPRRRERALLFVVTAAAAAALLVGNSTGQDWPQFRGVHRDGISPETGLLQQWPEKGPREVWRQAIGEGYSGMAAVGERLYTMYSDENEGDPTDFAAAFDAGTGKELWRTAIGKRYDTEFGNGPRSTPTVDGDTAYVLGAMGDLVALSAKDGTERWRINLTETFGGRMPGWGFATSALVDGDQLVIEGGGSEGKSYAALDKETGEVEWTFGEGGPGYNSALAINAGGERRYIYFGGDKLNCINGQGEEVWSHVWPQGETHAMPVFVPPDKVFGSGAEGIGASLLKIHEEEGSATVEETWRSRFMRNHFSSSLYFDGHIYGFDNATLKSISLEDGKMNWGKRGLGKGSLILADGHLIVLSDRGKLLLVEASPDGYVEKGAVQALEGRSWTSPTLADGRLYVRNHTEMVSYDIKN